MARRFLRYYDFSPPAVKRTIHTATHAAFHLVYRLRVLNGARRLPLKRYAICSTDVNRISSRVEKHSLFSKYLFHGVVLGGDWDFDHQPIESTPLYQFSRDVFMNNRKMDQTDYYQQILRKELEPYIHDESHLKLRMNAYLALFRQIRRDGYRSQHAVPRGNLLDEICISIDRSGSFILEDGRHRFMIAKCLDIKKIPVIINRVHEGYWRSRSDTWDAELEPYVGES